MGKGVAELAVLIEAAGEEIVEHPGPYLLELGDDRLGLGDGFVDDVED